MAEIENSRPYLAGVVDHGHSKDSILKKSRVHASFRHIEPLLFRNWMNKRRLRPVAAIVALVGIMFTTSSASASVGYCGNTTIQLIAQNAGTGSAHFLDPVHSSCACRRGYIEFTDHALFAMALSAVMSGQAVNVMWETNATAKGSPSTEHGPEVTCKILNIWK